MMKQRDWDKLKKELQAGTWKMIRLVELLPDNETHIVVPFNSASKPDEVLTRLAYIKKKVDNGLPAGDYQIECRVTPTNARLVDVFPFTIKPKQITLRDDVEDKTKEQIEDMPNNVDFDDYVDLIKENAELKAQNSVLIQEVNFYKKELDLYRQNKTHPSLQENAPEKSTTEIIVSTIGEGFASAVPIIQEMFNLQHRKLDIEEKKLTNTKKPNAKKTMGKKQTIEERAQEIADELYNIEEENPDEFDRRLDELEEKDASLYELVCEILGIEEEEEEDEEEGEEVE